MKSFVVGIDDVGRRADIFISEKFPSYSRAGLLKLFKNDMVKLNGIALKPGYKLRQEEEIAVDTSLLTKKVPEIDVPVIFEDEDVLVIDKPSGVLSHTTGGLSNEPSVASFIRSRLVNELRSSGSRAGIVHRLDRPTSGVMICAKNTKSMKYLQKQFASRKVRKTYLAVVTKQPSPQNGMINLPIARSTKNPKKFTIAVNGKPSITEYHQVSTAKGHYLLELKPTTGRTHQLRVHLSHIGLPIVGDELYGGEKANRLMLHASELEILLPSGELKSFISPAPKEFF